MKRKSSLIVGVLVLGVLASASAVVACGGDDEPAPATPPKNLWEAGTSNATEQLSNGCETNGILIKGGTGAGGACERATDCNAVCCKCPAGMKAWSAASCVSGTCADEATACGTTKDDGAFCSE